MAKNETSGLGEIDLFGLDEFGSPEGLAPLYGALIGSGLQAAVAVGVRQATKKGLKAADWAKWSEGIGVIAASIAGGAMYFFPQTKGAGVAALAGALGGVIRQGEALLLTSEAEQKAIEEMLATVRGLMPAAAPVKEGGAWGGVQFEPANLRGVQAEQLNGAQPEMISGLGNLASNPGAQQVALLNGPAISGLASHYGATLFGAQ